MVAGGGASVVYSDAIAAHGFAHELANYGEYSGAPTEGQTYEYAKTIRPCLQFFSRCCLALTFACTVDLMTRGTPNPEGKILIIGGGIANFTNVAATFKGIIRALKQYQHNLQQHKVRIFVRRAGPNYQEGLKAMRLLGETLGVEIQVFGPETHITAIVPMALGVKKDTKSSSLLPENAKSDINPTPAPSRPSSPRPPQKGDASTVTANSGHDRVLSFDSSKPAGQRPWFRPFDETTRSLIYGLQPRAIQGMLDFDFACGRDRPSVAAMIYPFGGHHIQKFYWGTKETLLPVYTSVAEAVKKCPDADVLVSFASSRSVYESTLDALQFPQIRAIGLIAEGVPERHAREILHLAKQKEVTIIGPATVGGIKPGCFRIGNTGGCVLSSRWCL